MASSDKPSPQRRAGQRPDELLPDENSEVIQTGDEATGSPGGEVGAGGMGGLPAGDGGPRDADFLDTEDPQEPQSGRSGGAVGGTPANKRSSGS